MPSGRDRPLSNTDPPSCNSSALTSRRAFALLVPEPTFSERSLQWLLFATRHFCRFGPFLTSTAPSAGGITPFLQNCRLTVMIYRLYSDSHTTSQDLLFSFQPRFLSQSNILCENARDALRCKAFQIYARKSRKLELVVDTEKRLVYTVIRLKLGSFRKVCYFAKTFVPFFGKRTPNGILFYVIPLTTPFPSTALRL